MTADVAMSQPEPWTADDSTFGARLALIRQKMGWGNVKTAAMACGVPTESWRNWERDGASPRNIVEVARTISGRTGCSFVWLLTGQQLQSGATLPYVGTRIRALTSGHEGPPIIQRPPNHPAGKGAPAGPGRTSRVPRPMAA